MNSLVVFLSVVVLAAAKPSGLLDSGIIAYSSPVIAAAPAAVSHQSRLDIKSSPAILATAAIAPAVKTIIAQPTLLAAPAIATATIAPSAVSSQSRIDIKTTPAITSTVVSAPVAYSAPALAYSAPALAYSAPVIAYNAPALAYKEALAYSAPAILKTSYETPAILNTAEYSPAIAAPAVPVETPEVIAARAAHFEAKALAGAHLIRKRSAAYITAPLLSTHVATPIATTYAAGAPLLSSYHTAHLAYSAPIALSTPFKAYSYHPW